MKKIIRIGTLVFGIILLSGCSLFKRYTPPNIVEEIKPTIINYKELDTMEKISKIIFNVKKESLKIDDLTESEKGDIARKFVDYNLTEVSGSEMTKEFQKYFGENQKVKFEDIKCDWDHGSEEENIMMIFDEEKDKYVYNDKHPGHGGGGVEFIGNEIRLENIEKSGNDYIYEAKILFYGKGVCHDVGTCSYGKGYKSYKDAENDTNALLDIDNNNNKYWIQSDPFPTIKMDELFNDYRDKLDTYKFTFRKINDNLQFISYEKA